MASTGEPSVEPDGTTPPPSSNGTGADGDGDTAPKTGGVVSNAWSFASVLIIVAAVVLITIYVVRHYGGEATDAGTILGIVIPVFATIGAAIFGVTVAYQSGSRAGQASGEQQGRADAADAIERELEPTANATESVLGTIQLEGYSPPGETDYVLGVQEHPVRIPQRDVDDARQRIERLRGVVRGLRAR